MRLCCGGGAAAANIAGMVSCASFSCSCGSVGGCTAQFCFVLVVLRDKNDGVPGGNDLNGGYYQLHSLKER